MQDFRRRALIKATAASLGALSLRGFSVEAHASAHFTHGIASGDPLADRVILWTRVLPGDGISAPLQCQWQVAEDVNFDRLVVQGETSAVPERDFTVKVDATGLQPHKRYYYRFLVGDQVSPTGRTQTLPVGAVEQFRLAVASCSNYPQGYFHAYRDIADADVDAVLHLGDYIYELPAGVYANPIAEQELGRIVVPQHELLALEDYRMRYGLYRTDPDLQAAHAAHPWITVWDDHELANNTWHNGAENHNAGEGDFQARMAAARTAYHEWLPIRTAAQTDQGPIYRNFKIGDLADLIMLDTRLVGRDEQLEYNRDITPEQGVEQFLQRLNAPDRQMLGLDQEMWLANQLAASVDRGAIWQVLGQQILMGSSRMPGIPSEELATLDLPDWARPRIEAGQRLAGQGLPLNLDAWDGYPAARSRLFRLLTELASNPVSVAGDTHNAWAFNLTDGDGQPVGVEIGTPGISSPGLESYLPLPAKRMAELMRENSDGLLYTDTSRRGWTEVTLTPETLTAQWRFVSSVLEPIYSVDKSPELIARVNKRQFVTSAPGD